MHDIVRNMGLYFCLENNDCMTAFSFLSSGFNDDIDVFISHSYFNLDTIIALVIVYQINYNFEAIQ